MPNIGTDVNPLRSMIFVRSFGNRVMDKTGIRVRKEAGNLEATAIEPELTPRRIRFNSVKSLITVQQNRTSQDRFIDLFV